MLPSEMSPVWSCQAVCNLPALSGVIWSAVAYFCALSWPVNVYQAWLPSLALEPAWSAE